MAGGSFVQIPYAKRHSLRPPADGESSAGKVRGSVDGGSTGLQAGEQDAPNALGFSPGPICSARSLPRTL